MVYEGTLQEKYIGSSTSQPSDRVVGTVVQRWLLQHCKCCESHHLLRSYLQLSQCKRSNEGQLEEEEANLEEGCTPQKGKIRYQHVSGSVHRRKYIDKVTFLYFSFLQTEESKSDVLGLCRFLANLGLVKKIGKNSAAWRS